MADSALNEVVVSASRTPDSLRWSPVSIQVLQARQLARAPAPDVLDALRGVAGIQVSTPSLGFKVVNARGFANTTNVRFAQLVDGLDMASPHIGSSIGMALGPGYLDLERIEIVPGVASALYGINAINGLVNILTKNPFTSEGLVVSQQTGLNHIHDAQTTAKLFSQTELRYVRVIRKRLALKITGAYTRGFDWIAHDAADLNANANSSTGLTGSGNPAFDGVNSYGNESSNRRTIMLGGSSYVVARTGYNERDLVDYTLQNIRGELGLYYRTGKDGILSYTAKGALLNNVYQRANRFRLENYRLQQHALQYQAPSVHLRVYANTENSGDSYNLRSMGENIDRSFKSDARWYTDYTQAFTQAIQAGSGMTQAHQDARTAADAGRYQPGTEAYDTTLKRLQQINNWDSGAALKVQASFIQSEVQLNLTEQWLHVWKQRTGIELLAGADYRLYWIYPDGNYFINPVSGKTDEMLRYGKWGGYLSVSNYFLQNKIKLGAILRADKNDYFPVSFSPRVTAVYVPNAVHSFRVSYQNGYRYPSIFEAFSNVNSGGVKRVGGLPVMSSGIFENAYLATSVAAFQQAVLKDVNQSGSTRAEAIQTNRYLLQKNPYTYLQPEQTASLEAGYRLSLWQGRLLFNLEGYYSRFRNFIAQVNMNVPNGTDADSIAVALNDKSRQRLYRMYTNSQTQVHTYGFSTSLDVLLRNGCTANFNTSFAALRNASRSDGLEDGFNTPAWMVNIAVHKSGLIRKTDVSLSWHWQTGFYWQSFLVNGDVPSYQTLDAQVTYRFPQLPFRIKAGASNLLNTPYVSFLGGPSIGGLYYLTLTYGRP